MRKHYVSKSAIFLAMLVATGSAQFVKAETPTTTTSPATSLTDASASTTPTTNTTSTVTSALDPNTNITVDASGTTSTTTPSPVEAAAISPVTATAQPTTNVTSASLAPAANTMATTPVEGQTVDVRIISTTDLHSNLVNYDYYQDKASQTIGLAKAAVLIDQAKAENPNAVLVDNGDILQGTPLGTYEALIDPLQPGEVHPMYAALDKLGFDASTLGNHEFNYGLTFIENAIASAGLPILNANVFDAATGEYLFQPYAIVTKSFTDANGQAVDLKIGITGIVPPQIMLWIRLTSKVKLRSKMPCKL
ncbi:bifunctional 2',3'-cyclic nucleotide 2'-phosphodiesterase/3'-nucleotidase protein [Streptococcus uberis]|nr:bifunctional 2',3'-cyclic nucleotide 2'-phosphodiesterase/3'-nucleotidase protein [Streptococcus uberis]